MKVPDGLKYTKEHEWVKVEGNTAVIGITEFAQAELGELVFVDLPATGKKVTQSGTLCVVESTKAASDVYAPISGSVVEVNSELSNDPALVNKDPFGAGWLVKLDGTSKEELGKLLDAKQYAELIAGSH
jgi:glycine cleavage system H protein